MHPIDEFVQILENTVLPEGWLVFDCGSEFELTTPNGRKFVFSAREVEVEDDE